VIVESQYCGGDKCKSSVTMASTACLVGAILGQLSFGYIGDCLGRSKALQLTMAMSILGALASAFAVPITDDPKTVFTFLSITRFFLGMGVGGVYPLSATIAAESAESAASRGFTTQIVFSMQGVANLMVPMLAALALEMFGNPGVGTEGHDKGYSWRFLLGLGAVPGILLIPFKTVNKSAPLSPRTDAKDDPAKVVKSPPGLLQVLLTRKYWRSIIGCAGGWFLFDITFYGNSLFQSTILKEVFGKSQARDGAPISVSGSLHHNLCWQMTVVAAIGLPGYYVALALMDKMGRRNMQLQGFFFMAIAFLCLGIFKDPLVDHAKVMMLIIYGLTFFFSNFGPNSTTFALPAECFPPHVRTTLNGFSAAMGKAGATLGSSAFKPLDDATSLGLTMVVCAVVSLLGLVLTWFFVPDMRGKPMEGEEEDESEEVLNPAAYAAQDEAPGGSGLNP